MKSYPRLLFRRVKNSLFISSVTRARVGTLGEFYCWADGVGRWLENEKNFPSGIFINVDLFWKLEKNFNLMATIKRVNFCINIIPVFIRKVQLDNFYGADVVTRFWISWREFLKFYASRESRSSRVCDGIRNEGWFEKLPNELRFSRWLKRSRRRDTGLKCFCGGWTNRGRRGFAFRCVNFVVVENFHEFGLRI